MQRNLAVVGCTIDLRGQAFVLASREVIALEDGLFPQYGSISLFHHLLWLLGYGRHFGPHVRLVLAFSSFTFRQSEEEIRDCNVSVSPTSYYKPSSSSNLTIIIGSRILREYTQNC